MSSESLHASFVIVMKLPLLKRYQFYYYQKVISITIKKVSLLLLLLLLKKCHNNDNNNDNQQKKKRICKIVDFAVPVDHRINLKESEKKDKYLDLARELKSCGTWK